MTAEEDAQQRPTLVGIGGDSGSGKTTLTGALYGLLGEERITSICLDDYHALDRRERALVKLTPLNPRANNFAEMEEHIWRLKRGLAVEKPVYDHRDGTLGPPETVVPREIVMVQGLHPYLIPGVRHAFDLKVWLDPDPGLRLAWKLQRDTSKRGYRDDQVRAEIEARRADAEAYIAPQRKHADLLVRFQSPSPGSQDMAHLSVRVVQRHTMPRLNFHDQLHTASAIHLDLGVIDEDGQRADVIVIDGQITPREAELVERSTWEHMDGVHGQAHHVPPERLGSYEAARQRQHSDPLALTQLILGHRILSARKSYLVRITEDGHRDLDPDHAHM